LTGYFIRRILFGLFSVWAVVTLVFFALRLTGDPTSQLLPTEATQEDLERLRQILGFDLPLHVQYFRYITGIFRGDFGYSYSINVPVSKLLVERLPATLELAFLSFALAIVLALPLGIWAAINRNTIIDHVLSFLGFLGYSIPAFWLGATLIIVFSVQLRWFPTSGRGDLRHLVLPTITLATWPLGQFTRLVRSEVLKVLSEDYVRTARAKGLTERAILFVHALRNAMLTVITLAGLTFGALLGGAIITETVFGWPGMGRLAIEAVTGRDYPLVQIVVLTLGGIAVLMNLVVDLTYHIIDPRVRVR
jgi:peptide/nickel transport system permease protein